MVTSLIFRSALFFSLAALLPACGTSVTLSNETQPDPQPQPQPQPAAELEYPGKGFIVHEWGTDTIVVGSDGSLQRGLHHEEEDLPGFVYDRIKAGTLPGSQSTTAFVKMETPVTYFYSDEPLDANVSVSFPKGILTQWYPAVQSFNPPIVPAHLQGNLDQAADPALDPGFAFQSQACIDTLGQIANGLLLWGKVSVLGRGEHVAVPDAPLGEFTWSFARQVDANPLRVTGVPGAMEAPQHENFLFYRGLGNFELPVHFQAAPGGAITATNTLPSNVGTVFVLNVGATNGAFKVVPEGIGPEGTLSETAPSLDGAPPIDAFVDSLAAKVTGALDATGLYHDEALAMVNTWKRQWFRTPGVRVLYLAPQSWTDKSIPLSIEPAPQEALRVMMIRVEVITPELETTDVAAAGKLGDPAQAADGKAHFTALGRFAEPRLRRALALLGQPAYGDAVLKDLVKTKSGVATAE